MERAPLNSISLIGMMKIPRQDTKPAVVVYPDGGCHELEIIPVRAIKLHFDFYNLQDHSIG